MLSRYILRQNTWIGCSVPSVCGRPCIWLLPVLAPMEHTVNPLSQIRRRDMDQRERNSAHTCEPCRTGSEYRCRMVDPNRVSSRQRADKEMHESRICLVEQQWEGSWTVGRARRWRQPTRGGLTIPPHITMTWGGITDEITEKPFERWDVLWWCL